MFLPNKKHPEESNQFEWLLLDFQRSRYPVFQKHFLQSLVCLMRQSVYAGLIMYCLNTSVQYLSSRRSHPAPSTSQLRSHLTSCASFFVHTFMLVNRCLSFTSASPPNCPSVEQRSRICSHSFQHACIHPSEYPHTHTQTQFTLAPATKFIIAQLHF